MAQAFPQNLSALTARFNQLPNPRKIAVMVAIAAVVAIVMGLLLWAQKPGQKVLFANLADKDAGAIVAALQQMNVPYTVEGGNVIKVPEDRVYDTRLQLATQGLPKGGTVGFELLDNQRLGISQFAEQVSYQRAVEGELARSIESIEAVESARVHLAFPKSTVFVREQQKPSASVLLSLRGGRTLDDAQVAGIMHLVSSSVPDLPLKNVTVIDQRGNLLSADANPERNQGLDAKQLEYVHALEQGYMRRIEEILAPIWGKDNIKAQVTAQLDFAQTEQTSETFKPNPSPQDSTVRSQQTVEDLNDGSNGASGVPGALSNQPPGAATAPLVATNPPGSTAPNATSTTQGAVRHRENTINYEVDKTISHTTLPVGSVRRLSVGVVVNYKRRIVNEQESFVPLTRQELAQVENLTREAMGFNNQRGDTLNVVNAQFADTVPMVPVSRVSSLMEWAQEHWFELLKWTVIALLGLYLVLGVLRPILRELTGQTRREEPKLAGAGTGGAPGGISVTVGEEDEDEDELRRQREHEESEEAARMVTYAENLTSVKEFIKTDPRVTATIIREWMAKEEAAG